MKDKPEFSELTLKIKSRNQKGVPNDFEILYDFKESFNFCEAESKAEFLFIRPWMQFPNDKYNNKCVNVAVELVHRFNEYPKLEQKIKRLEAELQKEQGN